MKSTILFYIYIYIFQKLVSTIRELESKLQSQSHDVSSSVSTDIHESLKRSHNDQTKEVKILQKTVGEMELRLETQKQTLQARDESIKKLLEMLQSKGVAIDKIEETQKELEKCRVQKVEDTVRLGDLKKQVETKEAEIVELRDVSQFMHSGLNFFIWAYCPNI